MPEPTSIKSRGALLLELARELRELKEELEEKRFGKRTADRFARFRNSKNCVSLCRKRAGAPSA